MKHYKTSDIRNIVLLGSAKSGKSTLAESMMFEGGVVNRMGTPEDGNLISDYHDVEKERQNSIFASVLHTEWRGKKINIIDTPGMDDFIGEVIAGLRVADTCLLTLNSQHGIEIGTEIIWRYGVKYKRPTILVATQVDHSKSDFNSLVEQAQDQFGSKVVVVQYPYNEGEGFNAIIDLLKMVMYKFPKGGGKPEKLPIPDAEKENADELHNQLVEMAAENDEDLMELYFDKGELDEDEMRRGLRIGIMNRDIFPLFCLSGKRNMGSGRLMGFISNVCPSPIDMGGTKLQSEDLLPYDDENPTLFVFKSSNEKHTGSMSFFKVCAGSEGVSTGTDLFTVNTRAKNRLNQLYVMNGKNRTPVTKLSVGDIGATVKLKDTYTNNTLRTVEDGVEIMPIQLPPAKMRTAISPIKKGDDEKMAVSLNKIQQQDPTLSVEYSKELRQVILHAQGELHLMIIKWLLSNVYGVEVQYGEPRVPYRETIQKSAKASYRHKKQSGGAGQFGEVHLEIEPYFEGVDSKSEYKIRGTEEVELPWGGKLVFCNCIVGGVIDVRYMPAILKGIMEKMEFGPLTGSYARDIRVLVYFGKMHPVDSNEVSFKIAGSAAFKDAFIEANPKLLEPVYQVEVLTPEEVMGDVMTDLQTRRAIVQGIDTEGNYQKITARVPLAELYKYATSLSSVTQGRATHTREFLEYAPVPRDLQKSLIANYQAESASS